MTMTLRYALLTEEHKKKAVNLLNGSTALPSFQLALGHSPLGEAKEITGLLFVPVTKVPHL
jgi:hypothetical protein